MVGIFLLPFIHNDFVKNNTFIHMVTFSFKFKKFLAKLYIFSHNINDNINDKINDKNNINKNIIFIFFFHI